MAVTTYDPATVDMSDFPSGGFAYDDPYVYPSHSNRIVSAKELAQLQAAFLRGYRYASVNDRGLGARAGALDGVGHESYTVGLPGISEHRLTGSSGVPVTTSDVTAITALLLEPFAGRGMSLYDGFAWKRYEFDRQTIQLGTRTSGRPCDVFAKVSNGRFDYRLVEWSSGTARATALVLKDGVLVMSGDPRWKYLGTFYTTSTTETVDTLRQRLIYNWYNQVERPLYRHDSTSSWTYAGTSFRQANASASNQLEILNGAPAGFVRGLVEVHTSVLAVNGSGGAFCYNSIGEDSTSVAHTNSQPGSMRETTYEQIEATLKTPPSTGYHYYAWLEAVSAGTGTFGGTLGTTLGEIKSGMNGKWFA